MSDVVSDALSQMTAGNNGIRPHIDTRSLVSGNETAIMDQNAAARGDRRNHKGNDMNNGYHTNRIGIGNQLQ